MRLDFTKMNGLGNDFVVVDATREPFALSDAQIRRVADRRRGIGCDQLLVVQPSSLAGADFDYRIFNADGSEVEQCGNGARCFATFVRERGLTDKTTIPVSTAAGLITLNIEGDGRVRVDMGAPRLVPAEIPFDAEHQAASYDIAVDGQRYQIGAASMGNPHAVLLVDDVDSAPVESLGAAIESHPRFPARVNVGFMQVLSRDVIRLRVFERGVGETQACGTGACAAVVVGRVQGLLDEAVSVHLPGGELDIRWAGEGASVLMTGPTESVFHGSIEL
jgi:diaminopimelate epimerase